MMKKILLSISLGILLIIWLFPIFWLILTSLKLEKDVMTESLNTFFTVFTVENYKKAFLTTPILAWLKNSIIISVFTIVGTVCLDLPIAYALARIAFKGRKILFWSVMATMMIPFQVLLIPLYLEFNFYGGLNTFISVIIPRLALPIGIFIMKQFYESIPTALEEAAFIDGANRFIIFFQIIVPLGKAVIVTTAIISFINAWNDFLWPLIAITDTLKYPITVGIANFQGTHGTAYALIMAGAVLASFPQFIFYAFFRKYIISGLALSGIKG